MYGTRQLTRLRDHKCDKPTGSDNGDPDSPSLDGMPLSVDRLRVENLEKDRPACGRMTIRSVLFGKATKARCVLVTKLYRIRDVIDAYECYRN
jgi:hypothetical protein